MSTVEATWAERELPFLAEALRRLEAGEEQPGISAIAAGAGLTEQQGLLSARALDSAGYITVRWLPRGAGPPIHGLVRAVSGQARRELGAWPSPDSVLTALLDALHEAAEREGEVKSLEVV